MPPEAVSISFKHRSSLGVASLVLGVVAFTICWIPLLGILGTPLSALGIILGLIGLVVALMRRGGVGYPIAGLATSGLALGVALTMTAAVASAVKTIGDDEQKSWGAVTSGADGRTTTASPIDADGSGTGKQRRPESPAEAPAVVWTPAEKVLAQDGVEVRILSATVAKVNLKRLGDASTSENDLLAIGVEIRNTTETRKVEYATFRGKDISLGRDFAALHDNFGNLYKRVSFGFGTDLVGGTSSESIYPSKSVSDVLVFERPLDNIEHLDLELPMGNVGGKGAARFRISRSMITGLPAK